MRKPSHRFTVSKGMGCKPAGHVSVWSEGVGRTGDTGHASCGRVQSGSCRPYAMHAGRSHCMLSRQSAAASSMQASTAHPADSQLAGSGCTAILTLSACQGWSRGFWAVPFCWHCRTSAWMVTFVGLSLLQVSKNSPVTFT